MRFLGQTELMDFSEEKPRRKEKKRPKNLTEAKEKIAEMALLQLETGGDDHYHHGLFNGLKLAHWIIHHQKEDPTVSYKQFLEMKNIRREVLENEGERKD